MERNLLQAALHNAALIAHLNLEVALVESARERERDRQRERERATARERGGERDRER